MKFEIRGKPQFQFTLTRPQITMLMDRSARHYDAVCKAASDPQGKDHFIHTWQACMKFEDNYIHSASWREMDITLKILEYPPALDNKELKMQLELRGAFWDAMTAAQKAMKNWKLDINT